MCLLSWSVIRHDIVSKWRLEVPSNHVVVETDEHSISDVSDVLIGNNHVLPDQVNNEAMDMPDISIRRDADIVICGDLKIFSRRLLSLKVT